MKMTLEQVQQAALELDDMFGAWINNPSGGSEACRCWFRGARYLMCTRYLNV